MTSALDSLKQSLTQLHLSEAAGIVDELLLTAEKQQWSYRAFTQHLLDHECKRRDEKRLWCKALIHDNMIEIEIMGWCSYFGKGIRFI